MRSADAPETIVVAVLQNMVSNRKKAAFSGEEVVSKKNACGSIPPVGVWLNIKA